MVLGAGIKVSENYTVLMINLVYFEYTVNVVFF